MIISGPGSQERNKQPLSITRITISVGKIRWLLHAAEDTEALITCIVFHIPTCLRHKRSVGWLKHNDPVESQLGDSWCLHLLLCDPEVAPIVFNPLSNCWPDGKSLELLYSTAEKLQALDINYSLEIGLTFASNQKTSPSMLRQHIV